MPQLSTEDRQALLSYFVNRYTLEQVETLLFVVNINRNTFGANETLPSLCTDVLQYCIGNGGLGCLLREALRDKPEPSVQAIFARYPSCEPGVKVEVTIRDASLKDLGPALKAFLEAHGVKANEVSLVGAAAGSLKLLLSMPAHTADRVLSYPVSVLAGGVYHVESVRAFRTLSMAEQLQWQQAARTTPCANITQAANGAVSVEIEGVATGVGRGIGTGRFIPAVVSSGMTLGKWLLIFVVVVAGGIGVGVVIAPALTLHNECGRPLPLPGSVPLVGNQIDEGDSNFKILPGDYTVGAALINDRENIVITGPVVGTVSIPLGSGETFTVMQDGNPVQVGPRTPTTISVGANSRVEVTLCGR
ncbi:MAG TPA: hypothetical protein VLQ48_06340 [Chloroflexia bacterium]|nr:hypothetical protein [Chloroflexia bacterium]